MKRLILVSLVVLLGSAMYTIQAQQAKSQTASAAVKKEANKELKKLEGAKVSDQAKSQFNFDFGNLSDVSWRRSEHYDEATFTKDGKKYTAYYDADAKLVGKTTTVTLADIPVKGLNEIKKQYKGYTIEPEVVYYDDNESNSTDMYLYGTQFEDQDNYFVMVRKGAERLILMVNQEGNVSYFTKLG